MGPPGNLAPDLFLLLICVPLSRARRPSGSVVTHQWAAPFIPQAVPPESRFSGASNASKLQESLQERWGPIPSAGIPFFRVYNPTPKERESSSNSTRIFPT